MASCDSAFITNHASGAPRRLSPQHVRFALTLLCACLLAVVAGCQNAPTRYALRGKVLSKDPQTHQVTINHEAIPGFMPAMAMPYSVKDSSGFDNVQPGDQITADVEVASSDNYWLDHLAIADSSGRSTTVAPTTPRDLKAGDAVPDVPLVNQDGQTLHLRQFKRQAVLVTFIYTRCPLPTFCPLISSEFAAIQKSLAADPAAYARTHLISISLDPSYDTAPVLRKYGLAYLHDDPAGFKHWDFVSTTPADLRKLADGFGLEFFQQDNQIAHSMQTVLLAPGGKVSMAWPGNEWKTSEVLAAVEQSANSTSKENR